MFICSTALAASAVRSRCMSAPLLDCSIWAASSSEEEVIRSTKVSMRRAASRMPSRRAASARRPASSASRVAAWAWRLCSSASRVLASAWPIMPLRLSTMRRRASARVPISSLRRTSRAWSSLPSATWAAKLVAVTMGLARDREKM